MRIGRIVTIAVAVVLAAGATDATAAKIGRRAHSGHLLHKTERGCTAYRWETRTETRTIYETVKEPHTKVVHDTIYEEKVVTDIEKVSETRYRTEEFTYERPVYDTETREVPYTHTYPVYETKSREVSYVTYVPSYETRVRSVPCTTYRTIHEDGYRTISYHVPRKVPYTKTVQVDCGHWETRIVKVPGDGKGSKSAQKDGRHCRQHERVWREKVWVPQLEEREITCYKKIYDIRTKQIPVTYTRVVAETHTRDEQYTVRRMTPVTQTRTVYYQVPRTVSEQRIKTVSHPVTRTVTERGTRKVPYTVTEEIPITRTVAVPRTVTRTVTYYVTRKVPREVTCEVRVRVPCDPNCKGGKCGKSGKVHAGDTNGDRDEDSESLPGDDPAPPVPEFTDETAATSADPPYRLTASIAPAKATDLGSDFSTGLTLYRSGEFAQAAAVFQNALAEAPADAKYAYFHAIALYQAGQTDDAWKSLATAVKLESQNPIGNWGRTMERVQGPTRIWLEEGRRQLATDS